MGAFDNMNPILVGRIQALINAAQAAGYRISPGSGYRDYNEQARLYQKYLAGEGNKAAPPGHSNHNHGLAMDLDYGSPAAAQWANEHAAQFGLHFPVSGENWHVEMLDDGESTGSINALGQMGVGQGLNEMSPEERQDALMKSFQDVIVGAQRDELALATPATSMVDTPMADVSTPTADVSTTPMPTDMTVGTTTVTEPGQQATGQAFSGGVPPPGYVPPGKGVERWRQVAIEALKYTGQDPGLVDLLLMQMGTESGGDPYAVNNWDSNAKRGDPTKGLMQNIGSAFPQRANELANRGIFDGFANMVASIRYTLGRYGSLQAGWKGHGY
jgi:hypothetical protein